MTQTVDKSKSLEAALGYLKRGFSVFPVHHPSMPREGLGLEREPLDDRDVGKRPLVKWITFQSRQPTETQIRAWWKNYSKYPDLNIGLATGAISGVFVVDADGPEAVNWIFERFEGIPETLSVATQRGQHFYFKHPGFTVRNGSKIVLIGEDKVDIRGDGGYVVLPPSEHRSGFTYEWGAFSQLMEAPAWLLDALKEREQKSGHLPPHELTELLKGVPDGKRHDSLMRLAGHWIGKGLPLPEVNMLCLAWNKANKPPSPDDHITDRVKSLWEEHHRKRKHNPDGPTHVREGDDFTFTWPQYGIQISARYLREVFDGLQGEVTVLHQPTGRILHWGRLKLASTSQREELSKRLTKTRDGAGTNWTEILGQLGRIATNEFRLGNPTVELLPSKTPMTRDFVSKLMPEKETTIMFADGGTGKSSMALAIAVAVATGRPLPNDLMPVERAAVLYLDWESCLEEHADRLTALLRGMGLTPKDVEGMLHYRSMSRPLAEDIEAIKTEVDRLGIGLVITDSYVPAAGSEPEKGDAAQRIMNALRALPNVTKLVLSHISKAEAENGGTNPFGSIMAKNLARSVWFLKRSESEEEDLVIGFYHRKVNRGRLHKPFGIRLSYGSDMIRLSSEDVARNPELRKGGSLKFAIRGLLKDGKQTLETIAEQIDGSKETVRRTLYRMKDEGEVGREGSEWFLVSDRQESL